MILTRGEPELGFRFLSICFDNDSSWAVYSFLRKHFSEAKKDHGIFPPKGSTMIG